MTEKQLRFTVDSNLLFELGERLVTSKTIALGELVKNSYDADATSVTIQLTDVRNSGGTITVSDDGSGMTWDQIISGWLRVATTSKGSEPSSAKFNRARAGSKGVGRFACRALAELVELDSVAILPSGEKERVQLRVDWAEFKPGSQIESVGISSNRTEVPKTAQTGLTLRLIRARTRWTDVDVSELRGSLETFSTSIHGTATETRRVAGEDPGMVVTLEASEFAEASGPVATEVTPPAWAALEGFLDKDGVPEYSLQIRSPERVVRYYPKQRFPSVGRARFRVNFLVFKRSLLKGLNIEMGSARKWGREHGGVKIYLDGFRVYPYGELGDDWLNLDSDRGRRLTSFRLFQEVDEELKRPALALPGNNQLYGAVHITRKENPALQPTITRDRLLANDAFGQLYSFVRLGIEWMTIQYVRFDLQLERRTVERRTKLDPMERLDSIVSSLGDSGGRLSPSAVSELAANVAALRQSVEESQEERERESSMLRVLATTGTLVAIIDHELGRIQDALRGFSDTLDDAVEHTEGSTRDALNRTSAELRKWATTLGQYGMQVSSLLGQEARGRRRALPLKALIDEVGAPMKGHMDAFGIRFSNAVPQGIDLPSMYHGEAYSIFVNLLTNSIKAIKTVDRREIQVKAGVYNKKLVIDFMDSGPGIPAIRREEVFQPFVSDSVPDPVLGAGTGLGLTIAREIVEANVGSIQFVDPPRDWNCCARVTFPVEE